MDCSPPASSVYGIFQPRIVERVAISYSRGSSPPRDRTCVSYKSLALAGGFFTTEPPEKPKRRMYLDFFFFFLTKMLFGNCFIILKKNVGRKTIPVGER